MILNMTTRFKAIGHRVLIEPVLNENNGKTEWVFDLSNTKTYKAEIAATERGRIVDIGPNAWKVYDDGKPWAKVGDIVIFAKHAGKFVAHPDDPDTVYVVINDDDVQLRIEE